MPKSAYRRRDYDATRVNRLVARLRRLSTVKAVRVVRCLIDRDDLVGLRVANRVLRGEEFVPLLRWGLDVANASTIRDWLEASADRIGHRRMIEIVRERLDHDPQAVKRALYWLPSVVGADEAAKGMVEQLRSDLHAHR